MIQLKTDTGCYDVEARVVLLGNDILVAISGGDKPHIGAVAAAQPRPSLDDPARTSATASVICFPAHKEHEIARRAAEKIAAALNTNVVVTAGIHWDAIGSEGISRVMQNCEDLMDIVVTELACSTGGDSDGA